jgi:hypothetical protein
LSHLRDRSLDLVGGQAMNYSNNKTTLDEFFAPYQGNQEASADNFLRAEGNTTSTESTLMHEKPTSWVECL